MAVAADVYGWDAITGLNDGSTEFLWYPTIFFISLGVAIWIATFDINYALMDLENDVKNGIYSFPSKFGEIATTRTSVQLTLLWFACFAIANPMNEIWFIAAAVFMSTLNIGVILSLSLIHI